MAEGMTKIDAALAAAPWDPRSLTVSQVKERLDASPVLTPNDLLAMIQLEESHATYDGGRPNVLKALRALLGSFDTSGPVPQPLYTAAREGDEIRVVDASGQTHVGFMLGYEMGARVRLHDVMGTQLFVPFDAEGAKLSWREAPKKV